MLTNTTDGLENLQSNAAIEGLLRLLEFSLQIVDLLLVLVPDQIAYRADQDVYRQREQREDIPNIPSDVFSQRNLQISEMSSSMWPTAL